MPEIDQHGLDVSKEEERFLRGAFRRFALPYVLLALVLAGVGVAGGLRVLPSSGGGEASTEVQGLVAEAAGLRDAIASLRKELEVAHERIGAATQRVDVLERRVAEQQRTAASEVSPEALQQRLDHAHQRINALEGRLSIASQRAAEPEVERAPIPSEPTPAAAPRSPPRWPASPDTP